MAFFLDLSGIVVIAALDPQLSHRLRRSNTRAAAAAARSRRKRRNGGSAAITFAVATVLERHLGWKHSDVAYAVASYVAASRLHDNVHYLSDVAFGAAVGVIGGRTVTQHGRQVWTFVPVSVPCGMAIVAMRP